MNEILPVRTLGKTGLNVSALGFSFMGLNFAYANTLDKSEAVDLIRSAFGRGMICMV